MEGPLRHRYNMLEQMAGSRFTDYGAAKPVYLNLIRLAADIFIRQLVPKAPRSLVTTRDPRILPIAKDMQAWHDRAALALKLKESLTTCAINALTGPISLMKVGVEHKFDIELFDVTHRVGQPYALPVDPDDTLVDMRATRPEEMRYVGNRFTFPLEEAKEDKDWNKEAREALQARDNNAYNEFGQPRVSALSQGTDQEKDSDIEPVGEAWDIYLPKEKLLITVPYNNDGHFGSKPLNVVEWEGPDEGPYPILSFFNLPNSILSPGPLQMGFEMHMDMNMAWRKMWRQVRRFKRNIGFGGNAKDDVDNYNRANDGEGVLINHPDLMKEMSTGGVDQAFFGFLEQCRQIFSWMMMNLDTLGGLSAQAQTLGQEELLAKSTSAQMAEMQARMTQFSQTVSRSMFQHWWENPILYYEAVKTAQNGDQIPVSISPQDRQIPFDRLDFKVDMYSMNADTPQTLLAGIQQVMNQSIMPMMPILGPQGYTIDGAAWVDTLARYGNYPDLPRILKQGPPPDMQIPNAMAQESKEEVGKMPANTTRTNIRRNVPGMTDKGQSQVMQQLAAGSKLQPGQRNGAMVQ